MTPTRPDAATTICVLGMHRSGTSLTARILNLLGVDLGPEAGLLPPSAQNVKGYWEQREVLEINDALLAAMGGNFANPPPLRPGWERSRELAPLERRAREFVSHAFASSPLWGFKDPRMSLTLPFWRELVPAMRYVICVRNPREVFDSLARYPSHVQPRSRTWSSLWLLYTARGLQYTSAAPRTIVHYEDFFTDLRQQVDLLASFCSRPVTDEASAAIEAFVDQGMRHHSQDPAEFIDDEREPSEVRRVYAALRGLRRRPTEEQLSVAEDLARRSWVAQRFAETRERLLRRTTDGSGVLPSGLASFPADAGAPILGYSGIYADGWMTKHSYLTLGHGGNAALDVRAEVLGVQHLTATVDGRVVASQTVGPGAIEVRVPLPGSGVRRNVQLAWNEAVALNEGDPRSVSARLISLRLAPPSLP